MNEPHTPYRCRKHTDTYKSITKLKENSFSYILISVRIKILISVIKIAQNALSYRFSSCNLN